jgi:hypothetical protein
MDTALLSPKALADAYDVPLSWVYNHVARKKLPYIKLGHYVRFDPEEMRRWLAQQRRGPSETSQESPLGIIAGMESTADAVRSDEKVVLTQQRPSHGN